MMATENYGAIRIGYSGNAESRRQCIFGRELQAEELFPDVVVRYPSPNTSHHNTYPSY